MRVPERLAPLLDEGVIHEVIRPLLSGKEAEVYLVRAGDALRVAKVYKEANDRSFRQRVTYAEGRKVRNSRQQRAMDKGSKYGREQLEARWRAAEVDAIYRLREAGVRVPEPYDYVADVLVMEYVHDADLGPAPRLADLSFAPDDARALFHHLLGEVVKMLCAGLVHGDLSDFNVLLGTVGPVIIDFPQAVDAAHNPSAQALLIRDVDNLCSFLARYAPDLAKPYGEELWDLYARGALRPDTVLTGEPPADRAQADTEALLDEIAAAAREAMHRRRALGIPERKPKGPAQTAATSLLPPSAPSRKKKPKPGKPPRREETGLGVEPIRAAPLRAPRTPAPPADPLADLDALLVVKPR